MILDTTTLKLEAVLDAAVAANQPEVNVYYVTWNVQGVQTRPSTFRVALNSNTDVTILAAPTTQNEVREVIGATIYNKDTGSVVVTVKTDDGTTERIIVKATLGAGRTLEFNRNYGWRW